MAFFYDVLKDADYFFVFQDRFIFVNPNDFSGKGLFSVLKNPIKNIFVFSEKMENGTTYTAAYFDNSFETVNIFNDLEKIPLRQFMVEHQELIPVASRAKAISEFLSKNKYCGQCGNKLSMDSFFSALYCPCCKKQLFPRIEPAVIVLVSKSDSILLARHKNRNQDVWACIAGFVEAGETIEHAVYREVKEETGLEIKGIRYVGSQSWPFPNQLMLAFRAEYSGGDIKVKEDELQEAKWFSRKNLPSIPPEGSVAYRLITGELG